MDRCDWSDERKIEDVYPEAALALFRPKSFLPPEAAERISGLTISEVMSRVRQLERKLAKELGLKERVEEKTIQLLSQRVTV